MKGIILSLVAFCLAQNIFSQGFINFNRQEANKYLQKYAVKEKVQANTIETDTTITFLVRDTSVQNLDLILQFNESGKCDRELRILSCDSCYKKTLNSTLNQKHWGWIKIDPKTYLSKFRKHLILNLEVDNAHSFEIRRIHLNRKEYEQQLKK